MTHRVGLYVSNCDCPECESQRKAILLGSNMASWTCPNCETRNYEYIPLPVNPMCDCCQQSFVGLDVYAGGAQ